MSDDKYVPALILHRCWGVASDVREDGFVNPSSVTYAPSEASAIKKASILAGVAVTCLVAEWEPLSRPVVDGDA